MLTRSLPAAALALAATAAAQTDLFSNASDSDPSLPGLSTGKISGSGVTAPTDTTWSELQDVLAFEANAVGGFRVSPSTTGVGYRLADDFLIPAPTGWKIDRVAFYVYREGGTTSAAPVAAATLRVWDGVPGSAGAAVVAGDATTNRLAEITFAGMYRVFNTDGPPFVLAPDTARPIWRVELDLGGVRLIPGAYWLDWQLAPADPDAAIFAPPLTRVGSRGGDRDGWNARQLLPSGSWATAADPGKPASALDVPQDLPFIVRGRLDDTPCGSDYNNDGFVTGDDFDLFVDAFRIGHSGGDFNRDGFITGDDFDAFMIVFHDGTPEADFNADGFVTGDDHDQFVTLFQAANHGADFNQDGFVSGDDFDLFVLAFEAGC